MFLYCATYTLYDLACITTELCGYIFFIKQQPCSTREIKLFALACKFYEWNFVVFLTFKCVYMKFIRKCEPEKPLLLHNNWGTYTIETNVIHKSIIIVFKHCSEFSFAY